MLKWRTAKVDKRENRGGGYVKTKKEGEKGCLKKKVGHEERSLLRTHLIQPKNGV